METGHYFENNYEGLYCNLAYWHGNEQAPANCHRTR